MYSSINGRAVKSKYSPAKAGKCVIIFRLLQEDYSWFVGGKSNLSSRPMVGITEGFDSPSKTASASTRSTDFFGSADCDTENGLVVH